MAHDLSEVAAWFSEDSWPYLPCGLCGRGQLSPEVETKESVATRKYRDHEGWEPDWISGIFSGVLTCGNKGCGEHSTVIGEMKVDAKRTEGRNWQEQYGTFLKIAVVHPPLPLIRFPEATPIEIRDRVSAASSILWSQPSAAANRLRAAVEELLSAKGVRKTADNSPKAIAKTGRKRRRLSTHERIEILRQSEPVIADALEAVKWIGNEGSHEESLTCEDVLVGVQLLGRAIDLSFDTSPAELARLAAKINRNRRI